MKAAPSIATGDVLPFYPYRWRWQKDRGEEEGRKARRFA